MVGSKELPLGDLFLLSLSWLAPTLIMGDSTSSPESIFSIICHSMFDHDSDVRYLQKLLKGSSKSQHGKHGAGRFCPSPLPC